MIICYALLLVYSINLAGRFTGLSLTVLLRVRSGVTGARLDDVVLVVLTTTVAHSRLISGIFTFLAVPNHVWKKKIQVYAGML